MTQFKVPPFQINSDDLPPPIKTSDPNSFAHNTLKVRVPKILKDTIGLNAFPDQIRRALEALYSEIIAGVS